MTEKEFYTLADIAAMLTVSKQTILIWRKKGLFPNPIIGETEPRWSKKQIEDWQKEREEKANS